MRSIQKVLLSLVIVTLSACGRYADPIAPEMIAPKSVDSLVTTPLKEGVLITWATPQKDRRGKELKLMDGYSVERKELVERGDETDPEIEFFELAFIPDTSVIVREELRKEARSEGRLGRTIKAPDDLRNFSFLDPTPQQGRTYLYQVVPKNQNGVKGLVQNTIKVIFRGAESEVTSLDSANLDEPQVDASTTNDGKGK